MFDVRPGELTRTLLMALYLMFVLFAYYILKNVSRAMFLNRFDANKLPWLWILMAVIGGFLAYFYSRFAVKSSLKHAVAWTTALSVASLLIIWWVLRFDLPWMLYVFNVWVSLFSIILVSQGWLVAANVFNSREAKRLYGILGLGAVLGAGFGSYFTRLTVQLVGTDNLLFAAVLLVILSYLAFWGVAARTEAPLATAKAAKEVPPAFVFQDIFTALGRYRHLQAIAAIILVTYMLEVTVDFQFSQVAKAAYPDKERLTAFLGTFSMWMVLVEFLLQFFLTPLLLSRIGVGGTLQIPGVAVGLASLATFWWPSLFSTSAARLTEESTRYTFHRTSMELLYLPLPPELKNRTKVFLDIFGDRLARGLGGLMLILLTTMLKFQVRHIALVALAMCVIGVVLSAKARREYVETVRRRLEMRRLDLEEIRISVQDKATVALLEQTVLSPSSRQAAYALSLLAEIPGYPMEPLLRKLAASSAPDLRAQVYEVARRSGSAELLDRALAEIRSARPGETSPAVKPAVAYALSVAPETADLASRLLDHPSSLVAEGALEAIARQPDFAGALITREWLAGASIDSRPERRRLAAIAVGVRGGEDPSELRRLLEDPDPNVAAAACRAAGVLKNRDYVEALIQRLADARLRSAAIDALASYGAGIAGALSDLLADQHAPLACRRQAPRVLRLIPDQRSVDALMAALAQPSLVIRSAALRALNRLREVAPQLDYATESLTQHILDDVRYYYRLSAALAPFRAHKNLNSATGLLAHTLEERLKHTLERLFQLLGLRYPPAEMRAAYLAVHRGGVQEYSTAIEFLDNILERDLKRFLLPLLDASEQFERGPEVLGIEAQTPEAAIRDLIGSDDTWLVACAMAAAAELGFRALIPEIRQASRNAGSEVGAVGHAAVAALM